MANAILPHNLVHRSANCCLWPNPVTFSPVVLSMTVSQKQNPMDHWVKNMFYLLLTENVANDDSNSSVLSVTHGFLGPFKGPVMVEVFSQ